MHLHQRTVNGEICCTGIGLHSGKKITLSIKPLPPNSGIRFYRKDQPNCPYIPARLENVVDTRLATTIGENGYIVSTVEHLLSAFAGMGIDNALVELNGPEVPIMDGSAGPFIYLLRNVGVRKQEEIKKFLVIRKPLTLRRGDKSISVYPSRELKITYRVHFNHPLVSHQSFVLCFSGPTYIKEISRARTFGFLKDVETLKNNGFARGGSLDNAIVLDNYRVLNTDGLRYEDEFVRHKILDLMGDLYLFGMPIIGHFVADKSGHTLNHALLKRLHNHRACWTVVKFTDQYACTLSQIKVPKFPLPHAVPA
ncbi:MAG: UDP-3-O-acyl-N-acetylglucosamine deacetylase [Deltaproteobacteria bacterium]|nr:UDP-3-O-acyl-N-acetylglucosamine deacetylase [Deltaproteobacteria bacterium]MBW2071227.1 UDP-3-O-acyl-N-acetylglucosamine deacetylase [Deltaproteobacteria bacterium]